MDIPGDVDFLWGMHIELTNITNLKSEIGLIFKHFERFK